MPSSAPRAATTTNETGSTPGPLTVDLATSGEPAVYAPNGDCVALCPHVEQGDATANAKLFAAAPEMLALLKECLEPLEPGEDCPLPADLYNKVCAVVNKVDKEA
jgi:hypothetical protein